MGVIKGDGHSPIDPRVVEIDRLRARVRELETENSLLRAIASRDDSRFVDGIPSDQE